MCYLALAGCGGGLPDCDDSDVIKLLKDIVRDSTSAPFSRVTVLKLEKVSGIRTVKIGKNSCLCSATGKFSTFLGQTVEDAFSYSIELADNGEEFRVTYYKK